MCSCFWDTLGETLLLKGVSELVSTLKKQLFIGYLHVRIRNRNRIQSCKKMSEYSKEKNPGVAPSL